VILTDDRYTQATPLYWETYARLRRLPELYLNRVPVMGGFIASTADGATTTLGRGGSDLSASIVGAGISAEEIQIWTDVDGMLTTDPRIHEHRDLYRLRSISYDEATEMARAGAKVLHPDSVMPAIRQHIPIVIRNSRNPANEGTRIVAGAAASGMVKSIACRQDRMVLEIRPEGAREAGLDTQALTQVCDGQAVSPEWIGRQGPAAFVAVDGTANPDRLRAPFDGCVQVRIHPHSAILTLVGDQVASAPAILTRVRNALKQIPAMVMSAPQSDHALVVVVPQSDLSRSAMLLHREFFAQPDPGVFAACRAEVAERKDDAQAMAARSMPHPPQKLRLVLQLGR
jgi:aspartate kinase